MNFEIGEIVIMRNATYHTWFNGEYGIIVGGLKVRSGFDYTAGKNVETNCYRVSVLARNGRLVQATHDQLKRLPRLGADHENEVRSVKKIAEIA